MALKLTVPRGNTLVIQYTHQSSDNPPVPLPLTGATCYFTVKQSPGYDDTANDSTALWKLDSNGNGIVINDNIATITSTPQQVWKEPGTYDWDFTVDYGGGNVITPISGTLTITGIPTNRASQ